MQHFDNSNDMSKNERIKTLADLIDQIKIRPELYIGDRRISTLSTFLQGYSMAHWIYQVEMDLPAKQLQNFHSFVESKFNDNRTIGWSNLILEKCNGDNEGALQMFFDLFREFTIAIDKNAA